MIIREGIEGKAFLALMTLILTGLTIWILSNGFIHTEAMLSWSRVAGALGAKEVLLENFSFLTPHFPLYLLVPFYYIPGLDTGAAPYLLSLIATVVLLYIWAHDLKDVEMDENRLVIIGLLVIAHPAFLWSATSGSHIALSMVVFYLLYRASQHIITIHDLHSYISLALVFVFFFFIDGSAIYIFIALIPLLVVIAPIRTVMVSPMSLYLIVGTPFAFAMGTWAYMNWIFEGSFLYFISNADSKFLGGMLHVDDYEWLMNYGGEFFMPFLAATGYLLIAFPASIYLLLDTIDDSYRFRASFVLLLHPLIAIAIATSQYFLTHPFEILTLVSAGLMAELTYVKMQTRREFIFLVVFMVASVVGGWWLFIETADSERLHWVGALKGESQDTSRGDGDLQLGHWLRENQLPTMMYEGTGFKAVTARGPGEGLVLSFSKQFKSQMRERTYSIAQVAVADPESLLGKRDWINIRHPDLYVHGMKGYHLVYDKLGWRVYRKNRE